MCRFRFVTRSARQPIRLQYTGLARLRFDTCSPLERYSDMYGRDGELEQQKKKMFLCSFASPQLVFETLKNCNFLFKVTKPFSSHSFFLFVHISALSTSLPLTGCRAGPSFPLIKYVCLYLLLGISAALHSRRVSYGKCCLPHNTVLSWADFSALCITQLNTESNKHFIPPIPSITEIQRGMSHLSFYSLPL